MYRQSYMKGIRLALKLVHFSRVKPNQWFLEAKDSPRPEAQYAWRRLFPEEVLSFSRDHSPCPQCQPGQNGINATTQNEAYITHFCQMEWVRVLPATRLSPKSKLTQKREGYEKN